MMSSQASTTPAAPELSVEAIAAISAISGTLFLAICGLLGLSYHVWTKHKQLIRDLESQGIDISHQQRNEIQRLRAVLRRSKFGYTNPGWDQLESAESISVLTENQAFT